MKNKLGTKNKSFGMNQQPADDGLVVWEGIKTADKLFIIWDFLRPPPPAPSADRHQTNLAGCGDLFTP